MEQTQNKKPTNGMAISALVLGIIAMLTSFVPFLNFVSLLMGALGVVLAWIGLRQIRRHVAEMKGKGLAVAGLVMNLLGIVFTIVVLYQAFQAVQNLPHG